MSFGIFGRPLSLLFGVSLILFASGCATGPNADRRDPLEPLNRAVFSFNDTADRVVLKPVATGYKKVIPYEARRGVSNFFDNLRDAWSAVNQVLQLKGEAAVTSFARFLVNSTLGIVGIMDVASDMGMERQTEDFGQTLGYWGVGPGPYIVLPLLGPSTLRDTFASPVDAYGNLIQSIQDAATREGLQVLKLVDRRARLLSATNMVDQVALDPYLFSRDVFLQMRRSAVFDGNPPMESEAEAADDPAK